MQKLDDLGWVVSRVYGIGEHRIEIRTTSTEFADWIDFVLAAYRAPQDAQDRPYFSVVVDDGSSRGGGRRFHILYRRTAAVVRTMDLASIARTFLSEIERIQLPDRDDAVHVDAAVAMVSGEPVLLPGFLVPLTSALGRQAERLGITLPGHSTVQLDAGGRVVPLATRLDVPRDAMGQLRTAFATGDGHDRVVISEPVQVRTIVQLARGPEGSVQPLSRAATLHRLGTQTMNLPVLGGRALPSLAGLVSGARCVETAWMGQRRWLDLLPTIGDATPPTAYAVGTTEDTSEGR